MTHCLGTSVPICLLFEPPTAVTLTFKGLFTADSWGVMNLSATGLALTVL